MRFIVLIDVPREGVQGFVDDWRSRRPKDVKVLLRPHVSAETLRGAQLLTVVEAKKLSPITDYCRSLEGQGAKVQLVPIQDDKSASRELKKFYSAKRRAEKYNRNVKTRRLKGVGSTKNLTVLPLIDWRASEHISTGSGAVNRLGVMTYGNKFYLYANGFLLNEDIAVEDSTFPAGHFGVYVAARQTKNFTIYVDEMSYWQSAFQP